MDKKEAKKLFLTKQLEDPNISDFEKKQIRRRLGIKTIFSKDDFTCKHGDQLISSVATFIDDLLPVIRKERKTSNPFDLLSDIQKTTYYLCYYLSILDEDSLEQLDGDLSEIDEVIKGFETIGRKSDAELITSMLKQGKITHKKITKILDHFQEDVDVISSIDKNIESFILFHINEIIDLQNV